MNLSLISFVGVDNHTSFNDILNFDSSKFKCEWSVLYSDSKSKESNIRYPECQLLLPKGKSL